MSSETPLSQPVPFSGSSVPTSYPKNKIKILLLERISPIAIQQFINEGFQVETMDKAATEEQLLAKLPDVHAIGVRSKTQLTEKVLKVAIKLLAIGCFCIGTDQTDLATASTLGQCVFNAPFANTRSVAELVLGELIMLARQVCDRSGECHKGGWNKSAAGCVEVRGKTLAIIGYGHVGSQLSVLAEALGMSVVFYDIIPKLPLGNAVAKSTMEETIKCADFVSLHVPADISTSNLMDETHIRMMKKGAFLINAARGTVVDVHAAAAALKDGHLGGAAFDVFPDEPAAVGDKFSSPLQGCPNTILTPHVGGSTEEAQIAIGKEVAVKMISYINTGASLGSVNLPELSLPPHKATHRVLNIHRNVPGVLREVNLALSEYNVVAQVLETRGPIGYMIIDVDKEVAKEIKERINALNTSIKTRILY